MIQGRSAALAASSSARVIPAAITAPLRKVRRSCCICRGIQPPGRQERQEIQTERNSRDKAAYSCFFPRGVLGVLAVNCIRSGLQNGTERALVRVRVAEHPEVAGVRAVRGAL